MPEAALLSVDGLNAWYGESHILHGVEFEVPRGEVVTLLGRNGVGKTTTLKAIMGLIARREGSIRFDGTQIIAMRSEGSAMICVPSKRIEPSRRAIMPMMAFRVVVLPTPFRPRSVTTSPRGTSNSTPWRMCDSPYHAFRPATERSAASGMLGAQVSLDHLGITGHRPIVALGDDLAAREHRDLIRKIRDDAQVVLDHEHGAVGSDALDERCDALYVRVRHAGRRFVEEHHFRIERERGRDLKRALAPIGQLHGDGLFERRQAHRVQQFPRARIQVAQYPVGSPEIERAAPLALKRDAHVFQNREMRKHRRNLERPDQPQPRDRGGAGTRDLVPVVEKLAAGRGKKMREQVEAGDRKSTRLNSSHGYISYSVFC